MDQKQRIVILAVVLVVVVGALIYTLTMRPTPPPPPAEPAPVVVRPEVEIPIPIFDDAEEPPLTLTALRYMPDGVQVAIGLPAATSLLERVAPFVQELVGDDMNVQAEIDAVARDLAIDMGVPGDGGLAGVIDAMGLDSGQGAAVFLDVEALAEEVVEDIAGNMLSSLPDMSAAKAVLVVPVTDAERAELSLKELTKDMVAGIATREEAVGDITLNIYDGYGAYFVTDNVLALGNDLELLKSAAAREGDPARLRYGTVDCPPDDVNEAVILIYGKKFLPIIEAAGSILAESQPVAETMVQAQIDRLNAIYEGAAVNEPMIITLNVDEDAVELKSKIDLARFPEAKEIVGEAYPLQLAQLLPENTLAFLSLCFNEQAKKQLTDVYFEAIPEEVRQQPGVSQGMTYAPTAMNLIGREITVAMTGLDPIDFPTLFLMIELQNPAAAQILLQMAPQQPHGERYRDVQIRALAIPSPIPVYFAVAGNALVISNSDKGVEGIIDLTKDEETSGFFSSLDPPIDPEAAIFQALLLKPAVYEDIVDPLATLSGRELPREVGGVFHTLSDLFNDVRYFSEMQDSWMVSRILVSRKSN